MLLAGSACSSKDHADTGTGGAANSPATGGAGHSSSASGGKSGSGGASTGGRASGGSNAGGASGAGRATGGSAGRGGTSGTAGSGQGGAAGRTAGRAGAAGSTTSGAAGEASGGSSACRTDGDGKTTLVFVNGCASALTFRGSDIDGGTVAPGGQACVDIGSDVEELSAKRYWGFLGEDPGAEHHTLAEFTFNTDFNDFDWYNISHVDAFNLPLQIVPVAREKCQSLTCAQDLLPGCPAVGRYEDDAGNVIACVSPDRNDGESEVALYFEQCDDAYAWSGDDQNGDDPSPVRACAGEDWEIVFCPEGGT